MRLLLSNFTLLHDSSDIKVIRVPSGEGDKLVLTALPLEAQGSPVYVIVADDFDGGGNMDIWLGGNFYALKPQVGWNDGSLRVLLKVGLNKTFIYQPQPLDGI